ncbi:DUF4326 domain-containing protein [Microbacterium sp. NPDC078849]|uniref:DUF4326 domain-containing protein n=1 Tax=unclassified Microbacterium TaxID=2609290 RepID=UPI00344C9D66
MPERVQLSRRRGYRKPDNTVVVARPSKWGNPFRVVNGDRARAVELFERSAIGFGTFHPDLIRAELAGKNLACWCPLPAPGEPDICHAAILLEIASQGHH